MAEGRIDLQLADAVADGRLTAEDAETVQEFATFLRKTGPVGDKSREAVRRRRRALIDHAELCGLTEADVARLREAEEADRG